MNVELEKIVSELPKLSFEDLLTLQQEIIDQMRTTRNNSNKPILEGQYSSGRRVVGFYRPTVEEVEAELAAIFTPEELSEINAADPSTLNLPPLPKSLAEMISEDREDRF